MKTKICTKCGEKFPATKEYFYKDKLGKYGLYAKCKDCHNKVAKNYRDKNKDKYQKYRNEHREEIKKYNKQYWAENKEELKNKKKKYRKENREEIRKKNREYKRKNKEFVNLLNRKRRDKKKGVPANMTKDDWGKAKKYFNGKCAYCGEDKELHKDHFIPLAKGGGFTKNNIIPACESCNCSKQDKDFHKWYLKQDFYSKEREKNIRNYLLIEDTKILLELHGR